MKLPSQCQLIPIATTRERHETSTRDSTSSITIPAHYAPLDPANLRADADVEVVATAAEAAALSARYDHHVRIDAVAGQLVYVHVHVHVPPPGPEGVPAPAPAVQHIGTLRGEELDRALELIYHRNDRHPLGSATEFDEEYNSRSSLNGTVAAVGGDGHGRVDAPMGCLSHLCLSSWQCMRIQGGGCGACMIFWCT